MQILPGGTRLRELRELRELRSCHVLGPQWQGRWGFIGEITAAAKRWINDELMWTALCQCFFLNIFFRYARSAFHLFFICTIDGLASIYLIVPMIQCAGMPFESNLPRRSASKLFSTSSDGITQSRWKGVHALQPATAGEDRPAWSLKLKCATGHKWPWMAIRLMAVGISAIAALSLRPYEAFRRDCGKHSSATGPSPGAQCVGSWWGWYDWQPTRLKCLERSIFHVCVCVYFVYIYI